MTEKNSINGRANRTNGKIFELWLEESCRVYWNERIASIEKTPEPMRPLKPYGDRNRGQFVAVYEKQAQPDFKGVMCDGSCIIFDAKCTMSDSIQQSAVSEHQAAVFDRYEELGAHCYVIISVKLEHFYRVPWSAWKKMKELYNHKYMARGRELEEFRIPQRGLIIYFLEGVEINDYSER